MNCKKRITLIAAASTFLICFTACSGSKSTESMNELHFSAEEISSLTISYDDENITFAEGRGNEIVIKEYMTINKSRYHAKVDQRGRNVHISEGRKPFFKGSFSRHVEVYLPNHYNDSLTITTTDGDISLSEIELNLSSLRIDSTKGKVQLKCAYAEDMYLSSASGSFDLGKITADEIRLETTSGKVTGDTLTGHINYTSTSGDILIKSANGSGEFRADNSGKLEVTYTKTDGDLSFFNKNDDIRLTLPKELEFTFKAASKNGTVKTYFQKSISEQSGTIQGTVGEKPTINIEAQTKNGNIEVLKKK